MKNNFRVILAKKRLKISKVSKETGIARSTLIPFFMNVMLIRLLKPY